jgi:hypothetical protein
MQYGLDCRLNATVHLLQQNADFSFIVKELPDESAFSGILESQDFVKVSWWSLPM